MSQNISFDVIARDKASSTFSRIGKSSESATARLVRFGKSTAGLVGIASMTTAALGFVKVGGEYVGSLNKIQALTGANNATTARAAKALESQSSTYAKMGQTVGDAAGGVVELTKAGLSLDNSLKAVNATMVLAKAGELSVADASSLVANTLNTFHLKASKAADIANYLANAANISSADVSDLAESFKYVAPVAAATGVSLKQTNAILAELSNSGIAASNAGTGFRKFLLSLQAPSGAAAKDLKGLGVEIFDASGKMKPLGQVIDILGGKLNRLTDERRQKVLKDVFGLQGISSATVILKNGSKGLETYTKGVGRAGAAQKLANAASKGLTGTLTALRAEVISDAQAAYRKLSPSLDNVAKKLLEFVQQAKAGQGVGGDLVHVFQELATVAKEILGVLDGLPSGVKRFAVEGLIAYAVVTKLTAGTASMGGSMTLASAKVRQLAAEMTYTETRGQAVSAVMGKVAAAARMAAGVGGMLLLADSAHQANQSLGFLEKAGGGALLGFSVGGPVGAAIGGAAGAIVGLATATHNTGNEMVTAAQKTQHWTDALHGLTQAGSEEARNEALKSLNQQTHAMTGTAAAAVGLGLKQRDLVNYITNEAGARERVNAIVARGLKAPFGSTQQRNAALTQLLVDSLKGEGDQLAGVIAKNRQHNATVRTLKENIAKLPKKVQTQIDALKGKATIKDVHDLAAAYKLPPGKVQTLIEALHLKATVADVLNLTGKVKAYGQLSATAKLNADTVAAAARIQSLINGIAGIHDKTVHITAVTNAAVAEHAGTGTPRKRAHGGPVTAGQPYIVGDRGPRSAWELFVPNQDGRILPHVPTAAAAPAGSSSVDMEQSLYRAFSRVISENGTVITRKHTLSALDLQVGAA